MIEQKFLDRTSPSSLQERGLELLRDLCQKHSVQNILEFGGGLSTEFLASILPEAQIYSLDHEQKYLKQTASRVPLQRVRCIFAPLRLYFKNFRCFVSYSRVFQRKIPPRMIFDLVLIDGPPGFLYGREAPLYQALPYCDQSTLIVLDDAQRPYEQEAIAHWQEHFGKFDDLRYVQDGQKSLAIFTLPPQGIESPKVSKDLKAFKVSLTASLKLLWNYRWSNFKNALSRIKRKALGESSLENAGQIG